eukprot:comp22371_c0_seq1/m.54175 comp22371_c0_seq1/g.54175  ORF comp22371_c0_seq1/g.54175 comp22371_c0_seq1/m.54175 type:complete len:379 (+) comp22371_c0_seq1:545-1681(+)
MRVRLELEQLVVELGPRSVETQSIKHDLGQHNQWQRMADALALLVARRTTNVDHQRREDQGVWRGHIVAQPQVKVVACRREHIAFAAVLAENEDTWQASEISKGLRDLAAVDMAHHMEQGLVLDCSLKPGLGEIRVRKHLELVFQPDRVAGLAQCIAQPQARGDSGDADHNHRPGLVRHLGAMVDAQQAAHHVQSGRGGQCCRAERQVVVRRGLKVLEQRCIVAQGAEQLGLDTGHGGGVVLHKRLETRFLFPRRQGGSGPTGRRRECGRALFKVAHEILKFLRKTNALVRHILRVDQIGLWVHAVECWIDVFQIDTDGAAMVLPHDFVFWRNARLLRDQVERHCADIELVKVLCVSGFWVSEQCGYGAFVDICARGL